MTATVPDTSATSGFGRGMLLLALANAAYIVTAYAVTTLTARLLEPGDFGSFGVVMAWITVLTALLVKGLSTVTAREMAAGDAATAWRAGLGLGVRMSLVLAVVGVALSPLAARLLGAEALADEFAVGALAALSFGTNAVLLAWPTGRREYGRQAIAQVAYAVARLVLVVGGAWVAGLWGAVIGYVLAPLVSSASVLGRRPRADVDTAQLRRRMARGVVPVSLVAIAVSAYFVVDIFAISAVWGAGSTGVGVYVAFGTVAHVPFFLLQAASVVAVPALAASAPGVERAAAVRRAMTDTLVLLAGPTLLLATAGDAAARVFFGDAYDATGVAARLALATGAVTIIANLIAVDVAIGRVRTSLVVAIAGAGAVGWFAYAVAALVEDPASATAPRDVAFAVMVACGVTMAVLALHARLRHGALLELRRSAAGVALALVAAAIPACFDADGPRTIVAAASGGCWLALVLRLRLVDVSRRAPQPASVVADPEHP